jgi:hypothetical protein
MQVLGAPALQLMACGPHASSGPLQLPAAQMSPLLQLLASSQRVISVRALFLQAPSAGSQLPTLQVSS